jgi:hypothetical protein
LRKGGWLKNKMWLTDATTFSGEIWPVERKTKYGYGSPDAHVLFDYLTVENYRSQQLNTKSSES